MARELADARGTPTIPASPDPHPEVPVDDNDLFPEFQAFLRMHEPEASKLPHSTRYRYLRGELPASFEWFFEHPDALEALARDARGLTPAKWRKFRQSIKTRAGQQKARRDAESKEESS
jgi:hypothetical protein